MKKLYAVLLAAWAVVVLQPAIVCWNFECHEHGRIREHLAQVERALSARDVSSLTPKQREARTHCLDALHAYWTAGDFPHNHDFANQRVPYFVDRHGTRCAMAALIEGAGGEDLMRRVARGANNARVRELAHDPELIAWLDIHGMTADEAAWVQPAYDSPPYGSPPPPTRSHHGVHTVAIALGLAGVGFNGMHHVAPDQRRGAIAFGVAATAACIVTGGVLMDEDPGLSAIDFGVGVASLMAAVHNYNHLARTRGSKVVWRPEPGLRVSPEGNPQLAVSVGF